MMKTTLAPFLVAAVAMASTPSLRGTADPSQLVARGSCSPGFAGVDMGFSPGFVATLFSLHFDVADGGVLLKTFDQYDDSFNYGYLKTVNATWSSPTGGGKTFVGVVDNAWISPDRPLAVSFYTPTDGSFVGGQLSGWLSEKIPNGTCTFAMPAMPKPHLCCGDTCLMNPRVPFIDMCQYTPGLKCVVGVTEPDGVYNNIGQCMGTEQDCSLC